MRISYVYILECADGSYYTGVTTDLDQRMQQHNNGTFKGSYTHSRRPVILRFYCDFTNIEQAFEYEKMIKRWSRAKKECLINEEYDKLPELAKKKFNK
ncbi:GIY-YIG nuclease family protein [Robertkochia sediminum]|uniref:GIY-YIG nuclease family protein n=1 Tax=Robertkochia sediminum TaxID=2785326 RepID=UPI001931D73A|nr:GIY-YIG nuclease family protein [Robertkochia sediminum]MBL7471430.1 GIY-YIG nuclease family protein [Robertkochia sediminum]